ncbi:MAG TPA: major capsid protein, partial [Chitinispirillaceae bacterium]|nr:major capsid protein [Chitinispirillaceae bacterium]
MSKQNIFSRVGSLRPGRSVFDLSYDKKFTCDMGQLIPVMCDEVVPGDYFKIGSQAVVRFQPLVAPMLHECNMYVHYFFVPNRLMWNNAHPDNWETFITGGPDGQHTPTIPTWNPTDKSIGSLWDFLGFPPAVDPAAGSYPVDFPRRAYNMVYNEYYRDENLITEVGLDNEVILNRCWEKDYFTSALPWQQRGTAPALPVSGTTSAVWEATVVGDVGAGTNPIQAVQVAADPRFQYSLSAQGRTNILDALNDNTVDLSSATTFDIADLRLAFQIQKWMERNARAGVRYTEFLGAHFGVHPRDERLNRPEYIGGSKTPIIVSEVLQTSSTDATTPQGNLAGHGIAVNDSFCGKYHVTEYGVIIGMMSIMPKPVYMQGINRQWLKSTKYDYYFPEFANLSEQQITNAEIFITDGDANTNTGPFGFQGRYDEMRTKQSMVCSLMRTDFDYWHMARSFAA